MTHRTQGASGDRWLEDIRREAEWAHEHVTRSNQLIGSRRWRRQWADYGAERVIAAVEDALQHKQVAQEEAARAEGLCQKAQAWRAIEALELAADSATTDVAREILRQAEEHRASADRAHEDVKPAIENLRERQQDAERRVKELGEDAARAEQEAAEAEAARQQHSDRVTELRKQREDLQARVEALRPLVERSRLALGLPPKK